MRFFCTEGKDSVIFLSPAAQIFLKKASRQDLWPDSGVDARLGEGFLFGIVSPCLVAVAVWKPSQFDSQLINWKLWSFTASQLKWDQKQPRVKQLHSCVGGYVRSTTKDLEDLLWDGWDYSKTIFSTLQSKAPCLVLPELPAFSQDGPHAALNTGRVSLVLFSQNGNQKHVEMCLWTFFLQNINKRHMWSWWYIRVALRNNQVVKGWVIYMQSSNMNQHQMKLH